MAENRIILTGPFGRAKRNADLAKELTKRSPVKVRVVTVIPPGPWQTLPPQVYGEGRDG